MSDSIHFYCDVSTAVDVQYVFSNHTLRIYGTISAPSDANRRFYLYLNKLNAVFDTYKINTCTVKFTENSVFKSIQFGSTSVSTYYYQSRSKNTYTEVIKAGANSAIIFVNVDESNYVDITIEDIAVYEGAYTNPPFSKSIVELHNRNSLQVPISGELNEVSLGYFSNVKFVVPLFALKKNTNASGYARGYIYSPLSSRGLGRECNCEFYMKCGYSEGAYNYVFLRNNCKSYNSVNKLVPVTFEYGLLPGFLCYGIAKMDTNGQDFSIFGCYSTGVSSDNSNGAPYIFPKQLIKYANANGSTIIYDATINSTITQLNYQYKCIEEL